MCTGNRSCRRDRCKLRRWSRLRLHNHRCWRCNRARSNRSRICTNNCHANSCMWLRCDTKTDVPSTRLHPVRIACRWRPVDINKNTRLLDPCRWHHFDRGCPHNHQYSLRNDRLGILKDKKSSRYFIIKANLKVTYRYGYIDVHWNKIWK